MRNFVRWYVEMEPFYKILFLGSLLFGMLALGSGMATQTPVLFLVGLAWLVGGPGTIWLASRFGSA